MGSWRNAGSHKYGARPTVTQGIRFASKAEARRYDELFLLERAGAIRELERQPAYPIEVRKPIGPNVIVCVYVADFRYREGIEGILRVEDVKGVRTPLYRLKKKLVEAIYGIEITEIGGPNGARPTGRANRRGPVRHGIRQTADRLALVSERLGDLGGWSLEGAIGQIKRTLEAEAKDRQV